MKKWGKGGNNNNISTIVIICYTVNAWLSAVRPELQLVEPGPAARSLAYLPQM